MINHKQARMCLDQMINAQSLLQMAIYCMPQDGVLCNREAMSKLHTIDAEFTVVDVKRVDHE